VTTLRHASSPCGPAAVLNVQVVVIAKEPRPGAVKTRLSPPLTPGEAASVAGAALKDTLEVVARTNLRARVVAFEGRSDRWVPSGFTVVPQRRGGFGDRLAGAIQDAWERTPCPILLIGMDTPQVSAADLELAAEDLLSPGVDAVLGPADDGGYWVIGTRHPVPGMFAGVPMSTDRTAVAQRHRLGDLGLRCSLVRGLRDVDTMSDARAVAKLVPHSCFAAALRACACTATEPSPA
jgi:uncharacterized protein